MDTERISILSDYNIDQQNFTDILHDGDTGEIMKEIDRNLIAPCGMNCSLCRSYQAMAYDLKKQKFSYRYCPGCIPRGENCTHMGDQCELLANGLVRFCFECQDFPCKRLKALDKRYRTKYHMSMIENLNFIRENGIETFLQKEGSQWQCPDCEALICCHNGLCLQCDLDVVRHNRTYRWNEG